ncbi:hypothetical protein BDA96_01G058800 [Sorghum bicolor]|uniref:BI1-like protein n=2 Tax=Sorghum bicolor TaxID=4558 RepID=A0A921UZ72_SORBI|nr:BI1-like protein [Sorghum bicolor]KAG0547196.1 hypothetical protein BDA96_01G058800 [Sorghum bicolor]|eukprot:XP_002463744.2 BI1-like protein [Sorghum bicolor]
MSARWAWCTRCIRPMSQLPSLRRHPRIEKVVLSSSHPISPSTPCPTVRLLSVFVLCLPSCRSRLRRPAYETLAKRARERLAAMFGFRKADPDLEAGGASLLYPGMTESPELRWAFVRKIYVILAVQLAMTAAVSGFVVKVPAVSNFFVSSNAGIALYIFLIILPFIVLCPLHYYHQKHPVNLLLLGLFTVAISFAVGMTCAFTSGKIILEAAILTAVVVISLTAYTFWAAKRGHDFNFLGPFLFAAIMVLMVFSLIQIFFPLGKVSVMIYGGLASLIFCGYIIYDTDNIIKRYTYDEYIWAAVSLYLDVINLFLSLLQLLRAADS